jgi:hypothetical protein
LPRFYFNYATRDRLVLDDRGVDLSCLSSAHLHALKLIVRTRRFMEGHVAERWTVQITDAEGSHLLTVLFPAADARPVAPGRGQHDETGRDDTPAALRGYANALRLLGRTPTETPRQSEATGPSDHPTL